jgi:hypothetical protein
MKTIVALVVAAVMLSVSLGAQDTKPVPKDSVRVFIPGCSKGSVFTAGPRTEDRSGGEVVPQGMHLRMNGPKKLMAEIKSQEGSMIEITGLMKKGQFAPDGVSIGGGVRVGPAPSPGGSSVGPSAGFNQIMIDVEGWRSVRGECPSR